VPKTHTLTFSLRLVVWSVANLPIGKVRDDKGNIEYMASNHHAAPPQQPAYLEHDQIIAVIIGLMAGMLLAALDQSIVNVALPTIVGELGGLNHLSWVVTAYLLTSTAVTPLWGKISDLYGRRRIFQIAIGIFILGSVLCGIAQNMPQLIAFRALQGIGGGGLFSIAFATIGDIIPPRDRGKYQGYFGAVFGLSSVAGPLLGGWMTDAIDWRWIFYINVPVGIAALVITSMALKIPTVKRDHSIDYAGAGIIVAAVSALLLYLNWAGDAYGWTSAGPLALLAASIALGVAFVFVELRAREPIIPMRLFRNSLFSVGAGFSFLIGIPMFGAMVFLPLYFQAVKGFTPTEAGLAMIPTVIGIVGTSIVVGQLMSRTGRYRIYPIIGAAIFTLALSGMSTIETDTPYWLVAVFAFFIGAGLGCTMQTVNTAVQNSVEHRDMGSATSSLQFSRSLGGAIGTAFLGAIFGIALSNKIGDATGNADVGGSIEGGANNLNAIHNLAEPTKSIVLDAYSGAIDRIFLVSVPFGLLALVLAFMLKEIRLQSGSDPVPENQPVSQTLAPSHD
jgi:EmrB/QacA subfamily drug resistance transporter